MNHDDSAPLSDLDRALVEHGSEYLASKERLSAAPRESTRNSLLDRRSSDPILSRANTLRLNALALALDEPATCRTVLDELGGKLDALGDPPPHLGEWSAHRRGEQISTRGVAVGARLFELVGVSHEVTEGTAHLAAFVALGLLSDPEAATILEELLDPGYPLVSRTAAVSAIGRRGQDTANPALASLLGDVLEHDSLRAACAEALGPGQASNAIPLLAERLRDPSEAVEVRAACASSVATLDPASARAVMCEVLDGSPPIALGLELVRHLQLIGDASCLPSFDRLAHDGSSLLASVATRCAKRIRARNGKPATTGTFSG